MSSPMFDTEIGADKEVVIKIERTSVSFAHKLIKKVLKCTPNNVNGWSLLCIYSVILSITSFALVAYLKIIGQMFAFCLYDNWFYLIHYIFVCLFGALMIPLTDLQLFPLESRVWQWTRRVGAYVWFIELEGLAYMIIFYKDIAYDIEYDDEAQIVVLSLATIGVIRFLTVSIAFWSAHHYFKRLEQRNSLPHNHFGSTFTDLSDILVTQLLVQSLYFYQITLYNIGFIISVTFLYIIYIRF